MDKENVSSSRNYPGTSCALLNFRKHQSIQCAESGKWASRGHTQAPQRPRGRGSSSSSRTGLIRSWARGGSVLQVCKGGETPAWPMGCPCPPPTDHAAIRRGCHFLLASGMHSSSSQPGTRCPALPCPTVEVSGSPRAWVEGLRTCQGRPRLWTGGKQPSP